MPEYDVQIQATIIKTERVEANTATEAIEVAHSQFTSAVEEGVGEKYDEQTLDCKEIS